MSTFDRRQFLTRTAAGTAAALAHPAQASEAARDQSSAIDFRFAPLSGQTAFCFPDDHAKSLIGERGELRYANVTVEFSLLGMEPDVVARQRLEAPEIPVVHTRIERPEAWLELTTFATNRAGEGRVDNVIIEVRPRTATRVYAVPVIAVKAKREVSVKAEGAGSAVSLDGGAGPILVSDAPLGGRNGLTFPEGAAEASTPLRRFVRLPQEGQPAERLRDGLAAPEALLNETRAYWRSWRAFDGAVAWQLPGRYGEFLRACARNILQAREMKDGRLTFQVGPTVYRGLWVVDGHFILEAARYLGYDAEAQQGLETTWARQRADGGIFAGGGAEHWKDTGIAMFTLVRQCELAQDFSYFLKMRPEILRAAGFLGDMRDKGRSEDSANGRYGLLPRGFGDGGLGGLRSEFTNTLWALAGLRAVAETAARLKAPGFEPVAQLHAELGSALRAAMPREMRRHAGGVRLPAHADEGGQGLGCPQRARAAAAAGGPMGAVARHLPGPVVRSGRPRGARPRGADAGRDERRYPRRDRLAAARGRLELQRGVRRACIPLGRAAGLGAAHLPWLSEPRHAAVLLARGTADSRIAVGGLRRRHAAQLGQRRVHPVPAPHAGSRRRRNAARDSRHWRIRVGRRRSLPRRPVAYAFRASFGFARTRRRAPLAADGRARRRPGAGFGPDSRRARLRSAPGGSQRCGDEG